MVAGSLRSASSRTVWQEPALFSGGRGRLRTLLRSSREIGMGGRSLMRPRRAGSTGASTIELVLQGGDSVEVETDLEPGGGDFRVGASHDEREFLLAFSVLEVADPPARMTFCHSPACSRPRGIRQSESRRL